MSDECLRTYKATMVKAINDFRATEGLRPLSEDPKISASSQSYANVMAQYLNYQGYKHDMRNPYPGEVLHVNVLPKVPNSPQECAGINLRNFTYSFY